ncbi:MAG: RimK family alpha-L-glutamate ligase [Oligoflexia bacterium]|nr:RimK family alpha-L-glutamate ligase [Oligoflexia bacterium]
MASKARFPLARHGQTMRLAILSRNKNLHSIRRLLAESRKSRHPKIRCDVINPLDCQLVLNGAAHGPGRPRAQVFVGSQPLPPYDAVLPRIGASITDYGLAVVKQFEAMGVRAVNGTRAIAESRDKMRSLQILSQAGLGVPPSALTRSYRGFRAAVEAVGGLPTVLKVLQGTQGRGVMLLNAPISLITVHETLRSLGQDVIIQQFLAEGAGRDYRAFIIGDRVVAAMMRTAPEGEFRSNIHRGGEGSLVRLPKAFERTAIRAARVLGLEIAGVDLMESHNGPVVLEVNSSPGFEGIERATGLNIAALIIKHIVRRR